MKYILFVLITLNLSCKSNKPMTDKIENRIATQLEMKKSTFKVGDTIFVDFVVQNNTNTDFKFCYWQTPLEKEFTAHFFEIIYKGEILPYIGRMIKRKPPTKEDNITLEPNEIRTQTISINDGYNINKSGDYSIRFLGRTINGLPDSKSIYFTINN